MDGWTIGLLIGGAAIVLLLVLMVVVVRTASKVASRAEAVLVALEDVRAKTDLSGLDAMGGATVTDGGARKEGPGDSAGGESAR